MANISQINGLLINAATASFTVSASYATIAQSVAGSVTSASYATTASFAPNYVLNSATSSFVLNSQTSSFVLNSQTSSMTVLSASYATTASYALNGGVTSIVAGTNVTISPVGGTGAVTINATGGGGAAFPYTGSAAITGSLNVTGSTSIAGLFGVRNIVGGTDRFQITTAGKAPFVLATNLDALTVGAGVGTAFQVGSNGIANTITMGDVDGIYNLTTLQVNDSTGTITLDGSTVLNNSVTINGPLLATSTATLQSGLIVTSSTISTGGFTGSLQGTASYAVSASWAPSAGGGGTPGGSANEVQYNDGAGGFSGAANVEISAEGNLNLIAQTDPATPAAGTLALYSKTIAGRIVPKVKGASGLDYPLQSSFWQNSIYMWNTTGATAGVWLNTAGQGAGTFAATNPTTSGGTLYTVQKRSRYSNVATTANQVIGQRSTDAIFFRGNAANLGGFFFYTRCGFDTWTNGGRFFAGMATATTVITGNPSTLNNTVGFCVDAADNGAISFLTRDTAATKQSTGLTITTGKGYDIYVFCKPNDTSISYRIVDIITGTEYNNTATLTLPSNTTALNANVLASNAAVTPVNSIQLGINKIYIETDY